VWDLKAYLKRQHGITSALQLRAYIESTVGIILSVQTLRALLRNPAAPRIEMIQLLCDVLNCRSDAFYLVTPNPGRAKQWEQDRIDGKKPSPLYHVKGLDRVEEMPVATDATNATSKPESLRTTYTDPRLLYGRRISKRRAELAAS
jgi:hypothetical protein